MSALSFRRLRIRRMPGFPSGGIQVDDLSPGINLVYGPNASGKTTTAAALHHMLWQSSDGDNPGVEGSFDIDGVSWIVDVEGRRRLWQRQGQDAGAPPLPPAEHRDRYLLSLHGLLAADDTDLAELIQTESAGGYNVRKAAEALGFRSRGWQTNLVNQLKRADTELEDANTAEHDLAQARLELTELVARHGAMRARAGRTETIRRALVVAQSRERHEATLIAVQSFPSGIDRLTGNEGTRLDEWRQAWQTCNDELATADSETRSAQQRYHDAGGADGIPDHALEDLDALQRQLVDCEALIQQAQTRLAEATELRRQAERELGAAADRDLGDITLATADRIDTLIHTASRLHEKRAALEQRLALLRAEDPAGEAQEVEARRQQAMQALRAWLRAAGPDAQPSSRLLWIAIGALLATGGVAVVLGAPLVLGVAVLLALVIFFMRPREAADLRPALQRQAADADFAPTAWTVDDVGRYLAKLEADSLRAKAADARRVEIAGLEQQLTSHERDDAAFRQERAAVADAIGLDDHGELALSLLAARLRQLQDAKSKAAAAHGAITAVQSTLSSYLARAVDTAAPFGVEIRDSASCAAAITVLRRRREAHVAAVALERRAEERREQAQRDRARIERDRAALFEAAGLSPDEEHVLRDRLAQRTAYLAARNEAHAAELALGQATASFRAVGSEELDLCEQSAAVLAVELDAAVQASDEASELHQQIATIQAVLRGARQKHDIEDALSNVVAATDALLDQREEDTAAAVGAALADWLRSNAEENSRPAVFQRGRELFQHITRHRYQLDISDSEPAQFRAIDSTTGRGHALDELSSGSRVQLLLAMRMAFVETMETAGTRLPLLMDEVLANCDDERAAAIIETAIALAEDGRQVFYFTAQADEHGKWQRALDGAGVQWASHDLSKHTVDGPAFAWDMPAPPSVPSPDGMSHSEYGRLLGVPPFDPWAPSLKSLHSWYLVDDVDALHSLLQRGLRTRGQIELYLDASGSNGDELHALLEAARRTALLCDEFVRSWQQGRGRPVDATVIDESGAVSQTFSDAVLAACRDVDGDAVALLERVAEIRSFRAAKIDELREHLQEHGHIGSGETRSAEDLLLAVQARAASVAPQLTRDGCRRLIERLANGASPVTEAGVSPTGG